MIPLILLMIFVITIILIIYSYKNESFLNNSKSTVFINKDIELDTVKINQKNLFDNRIDTSYYNNKTEILDKSSVYWGDSLNLPKNEDINIGNTKLTAKKIRDYKRNKPGSLELDDSGVIGSNYKIASKGRWGSADMDASDTVSQIDEITRTDNTNTVEKVNIGGQIENEIRKKQCLAKGPKNKYNKYYSDPVLKGIEYPGCDSYCCSPLVEPEQIIYDKLCIGDTCINGEHLKILKGDKMISLKSNINNKCISYPPIHNDTPISWPTFSDILTDSDCVDYKKISSSYCSPGSGHESSNIGKYKKGSPSDAKNACNLNPECHGFTYRYDTKNTIDNQVWKNAFKEIPSGQYILKNEITGITSIDGGDTIYACYANSKSDINNEKNTNKIHYQMVLGGPMNVDVTMPTNISKVLEEESQQNAIIQQLNSTNQASYENKINNYNLQETQTLEADYPPAPVHHIPPHLSGWSLALDIAEVGVFFIP